MQWHIHLYLRQLGSHQRCLIGRDPHLLYWNQIRLSHIMQWHLHLHLRQLGSHQRCLSSVNLCLSPIQEPLRFSEEYFLLQSILNKILTFAKYSLQNIYLCKEFFTKYLLLQSISNKILTLAKHSLQNIYMCNVFLTKYLPVQRIFFTKYLLL